MTNLAITGPRLALPAAAAAPTDDATPSADAQAIATEFPAGPVSLERSGLKLGTRITGGVAALGGAAVLGLSIFGRGGGAAAGSRLLAGPLVLGGGLLAVGAGAAFGASLIPDATKFAVATNIPTRGRAQEIARSYPDRITAVVQDTKTGKFAVLDTGPARSAADHGYERGQGHYYGDGHFHGQHYYGDGHYHSPGYADPYYPGAGNYYPDPYYPSPSYPGGTSPGDDGGYDYPSYPSNSGNGGTSNGDDNGGGSYNPPSYDPPSYDPPSYDPPSYDPPSYDPPSYDPPSGGNSSDNGNPSEDDF
ncbi:MAG: hypothetical protein JWM86_2481 [Thermoleophilia bacterium]|nr:hypothetical protein [Thermoleophilia bacterium]